MKEIKKVPITINKDHKTPLKNILIGLMGVLGVVYLLNFGFGIWEFLPDNLPIIGNVDEVVAVYFVYISLNYFDLL